MSPLISEDHIDLGMIPPSSLGSKTNSNQFPNLGGNYPWITMAWVSIHFQMGGGMGESNRTYPRADVGNVGPQRKTGC